ncbi:MAG: hypothetical protein IK130_05265 [Oscillospiraceae bacterium]|nr:hypothetical protein [Oscillospiraceae bacterium]
MDNAKPIRVLATVGVIVKILQTILTCAVYLFPQFALGLLAATRFSAESVSITRHPINFVMPILSLIAYLFFFRLVMNCVNKRKGKPSVIAISTGIWMLIVMPLASLIFSYIRNAVIARLHGVEEYAVIGTLSVPLNYVSLMTTAAVPALFLAAGLLWYRERYLPQNPQ